MGRQKNDGRGRLGGREKGTPNKEKDNITKASFRRISEKALMPNPKNPDGLSDFELNLKLLEPKEWITAMLRMAEFHTGRMKSVDMNVDADNTPLAIDAKLRILSGEDDKE